MTDTAYHEPETLEAALALLADDESARCYAGGQTLVAMMNARLVEPSALVSLRRIRNLSEISWQSDGSVRIGAMATHSGIARDAKLRQAMPLIAEAAAAIAHPPIRNMGTIGGAICHADPAADYPPALVAAGASVEITGREGRRTVAAGEFFVDYFTTAVEAGEIVTAIVVPRPPERSAGHFLKYARVDGDYATVSVAGILALDGGTCSAAQFAIGACAATPVRSPEAEQALVGSRLDKAALDAAAAALLEHCDPVDDVRGSAAYRSRLVPRLLTQAISTLRARLEGQQ